MSGPAITHLCLLPCGAPAASQRNHPVRPLEGWTDAWLAYNFPFVNESLVKKPVVCESPIYSRLASRTEFAKITSMAMFSRRALQHILGENACFLYPRQIKAHVNALNRMHTEESVHAEWEVVLLNAFSKLGSVLHEKEFGGARKGDIYFESLNDSKEAFLADITTISDKGLDKLNPFEWLFSELMRTVREHGLPQHLFRLEVGTHNSMYSKEGRKVRLKIPGQTRVRQLVFNNQFRGFLSNIARAPSDRATYKVKSHETDIIVGYDPNQRYASGGHTSYKTVYSLHENLLYSSLLEKANQLRGTGFRGPLGVFVCDGGCEFLTTTMSRGLSYEPKDVIHEFLREERLHERLPVQFVVTFTIVYRDPLKLSSGQINIQPYAIRALYETQVDMIAILKRLQNVLPVPERNALNAIALLKGPNPYEGASFWGGLTMSERKVKISARSLLGLLAGTVSQADFFKAHGFVESEDTRYAINAFHLALKSGRLISNVAIEKVGSADDEWIIFEFGDPDPAVMPFAIPQRPNDNDLTGR